MQRRSMLKTIGGIGAASVLGSAGLLASTGSVAAASSDLTVSDPSTVTTDAGQLKWLAVTAELRTEWDGFDEDVHYARYIDKVTLRPNSDDLTYEINDTFTDDFGDGKSQGGDGWGGDGEYYSAAGTSGFVHVDIDWGICQANRDHLYDSGYGLPANPAPVAPLEADSDGETMDSTVVLTKQIRLYGAGTDDSGTPNNPLTGPSSPNGVDDPTAEATIDVSVTNQAATSDSDGSGSATLAGSE